MQTVGKILRTEREKQGLSLKDIEKGTSIRSLYIQAIEDDEYQALPGEVYLKGFLRNYANFLGLDQQEILNIYRQSQAPVELPQEQVEATNIGGGRKADYRNSIYGRWPVIVILVVIIVAVVLGVIVFGGKSDSKSETPSQIQPAQNQVLTQTPPATPAAPNGSEAADVKPVVVSVKVTDKTWIMVSADGKQVYEGTPQVGENFTWSADKSVTIKLGNAAGVDMTYNGQPQAKLGDEGEVVLKTFSANSTNSTKNTNAKKRK
ncbi:MAG: putative transcriptional regulator [Firmicutes bacterium]|nr:putative transcriptional regulator [Bacillota bacterium]